MTRALVNTPDSAVYPPFNTTARSSAPSQVVVGDWYLDDGTNTASGNPGFRRYNGSSWEDISAGAGSASPLTTDGDLYYYNTADARLAIGTNGQKLGIASGLPAWYTPASDTDQPDLVTDPTTSSTSFVPIDATNLSISITAQTTKILINFYMTIINGSASNNAFNLYVDIDGGGYNALATQDGLVASQPASVLPISFAFLHTGLTVGSVYTYRPYWKVSAGTVSALLGQTGGAELHPQFSAVEVG